MPYDIKEAEKRWRREWRRIGYERFDWDSDKPIYSIDVPPRYASGKLHIGHATHYTHQDILARYKRMRGYNVFFPLCFDVNGMPIEVQVEKKLGKKMRDVPRKEFVEECRRFADEKIEIMKKQFELLGIWMDETLFYRTDAEYYRRITQLSFIEMWKKGLVYRGEFPVNWCPRCETAIADAELEYREEETELVYMRFRIQETGEDLIIASTRPELLCAIQMVAVHPEDGRYKHLIGKHAVAPIFGRVVEIRAEEGVDPSFGTGAVMICTFGDKDDVRMVFKHKLGITRAIDREGRMTEECGPLAGLPVREARERIKEMLREEGLLIKAEKMVHNVATCWRCHTPVEFIVTPQWFFKTREFGEEVLRLADEIRWFPEHMKKRLIQWVNSLDWDWVISRQRYFATPIPVWICEDCGYAVVATEDQPYVDPLRDPPPVERCPQCGGRLRGSDEVFDTWVDSSITPLYNAFWKRDESKFEKLFPMSLRIQSHDIIRTWAYYTIIRSMFLTGQRPWNDIVIDGFILGPDGRPMHASWGNVVDPLEVIEEFGADPFRYFASKTTPGEDTAFRYKEVVRGSRLVQKIWNAALFAGRNSEKMEEPPRLRLLDKWILNAYSRAMREATAHMDSYRWDRAMKVLEDFFWGVFADHYIEAVKHRLDEANTKFVLFTVGYGILRAFAPFLPFVTEDAYQNFFKDKVGLESIHLSPWPTPDFHYPEEARLGETLKEVIAAIRREKAERGLSPAAPMSRVLVFAEGEVLEALKAESDEIAGAMRVRKLEVADKGALERRISALRPNYATVGPILKGMTSKFVEWLRSGDPGERLRELRSGEIVLDGVQVRVHESMVQVEEEWTYGGEPMKIVKAGEAVVGFPPRA